MQFRSLKYKFEPYADVIIFMVTLLAANYFWKFTVTGDEHSMSQVTWFGLDITAPFEFMSAHIASVVYWLVSLFRDTAYMVGDYTVRFETGTGSSIIWGCSGLKQAFIWMCLMLTVRGGWIHKIWFIPAGWVVCHAFNILRIFIITLCVEFHPTWFYMLHDILFKYLFYGLMFAMWALFVEKIRGPIPVTNEQ